jgi:hypothetical protein
MGDSHYNLGGGNLLTLRVTRLTIIGPERGSSYILVEDILQRAVK